MENKIILEYERIDYDLFDITLYQEGEPVIQEKGSYARLNDIADNHDCLIKKIG